MKNSIGHGVLMSLALGVYLLIGPGPSLLGAGEAGAGDGQPTDQQFHFDSYQRGDELFQKLGYTPERWQAGIREIPRVYLTNVPERWRDKVSKEISVQTKKRIFFRAMGPLVLHANELILADREKAQGLVELLETGKTLNPADQDWLTALAVQYKVVDTADSTLDRAALSELLSRVDIVPPSLVLSQAAEESGWGTSRFTAEGNALFGQWSWSANAIKPDQQRAALGNYGIAAFETPLQSIMAYMANLNTHSAYGELRTRRAELRKRGEKLSGRDLAGTLTKYSERGPAYVDSLHSIMKVNHLDPTDDAYLDDGPTIYLVPSGEGVK